MTCGIYLLTFGDNLYYVGLSKNIENRLNKHKRNLRNGEASDKLLAAYAAFGDPTISILEECGEALLASREKYYIEKYDSYFKGLNANKGGSVGNIDTEETRIKLFDTLKSILTLYTTNRVTTERIAEYLNTEQKIVVGLLSGTKYTWIRDAFENLYDEAINTYKIRNIYVDEYPAIVNSKGEVVKIPNKGASKFARENKIHPGNLSKLLRGKINSCGGWRLSYSQ